MIRRPPRSTLFPYTAHVRSYPAGRKECCLGGAGILLLNPHSRLRHVAPLCSTGTADDGAGRPARSAEHTSELQSRQYLACRLLLAYYIPYVFLLLFSTVFPF